jgi:hypothetical protein
MRNRFLSATPTHRGGGVAASIGRRWLPLGAAFAVSCFAAPGIGAESTQNLELLARSDFDTPWDLDGWWVTGAGNAPTWEPEGCSGGALSASDKPGTSSEWHWIAPQKFLKHKDRLYGSVIEFDLAQSETTGIFSAPQGILYLRGRGPKGAFLELVLPTHEFPLPAGRYHHYAIKLTEESDWRHDGRNGPAATPDQVKSVLRTLDTLRIRGEFSGQRDVGHLDNVRLWRGFPGPAPSLRVVWQAGDRTLRLEWRSSTSAWTVEAASSIDPCSAWKVLPELATRDGELHFIRVPPEHPARFFRLTQVPADQ